MRLVAAALLLAISGCSTTADHYVISKSDIGITVKSDKLPTVLGPAVLAERDRQNAAIAQEHCASLGKNSVMTVDNAALSDSIVRTYECR